MPLTLELPNRPAPTGEAFHASSAQYLTLINGLLHGVVIQDADGLILSANPAAERILGLTLEQLLGHALVDPTWRCVHEDGSTFPRKEQPAAVAQRTGQSVPSMVMGIIHPERGDTRWISLSATPYAPPGEKQPTQIMSSFRDITDRKRVEDALRDSQTRLLRAEAMAHIGHWELNLTKGTVRVSAGACHIYGVQGDVWSLTEAKRIPLLEDRPWLDAALTALIEDHQPYDVEYRIRRVNDCMLRTIRSKAEYDPIRRTVFGVIHDITERKEQDVQLARLQAQLVQAQQRVQGLLGSANQSSEPALQR